MQIIEDMTLPCRYETPLSLSIGNFDGVHKAHQQIFSEMRKRTPKIGVVTFKNHPRALLEKRNKPLIHSFKHRLRLLEAYGVDCVYSLTFSDEIAQLSSSAFLKKLKQATHFSHLCLGYDAAFGHKREGTPELLSSLSQQLQFTLSYLPQMQIEGSPISSTTIRDYILTGSLTEVEKRLGRPYSIFATVQQGEKKGRLLGFRTANLPLEGLVTPPYGVYILETTLHGIKRYGVGNLGVAPTLASHRAPLLEAHFFDCDEDLYGQEIEVKLTKFLRKEKAFSTPQELKTQIQKDKERALNYVSCDLKSL